MKKVAKVAAVSMVAVCALNNASSALNGDIVRYEGKDRFQTSLKIAKEVKSDTVFLVSGTNFADALSVGPIAYEMKSPILLVNDKNGLEENIKEIGSKKIFIVGGYSSVSKEIEDSLKGYEVKRISGANRYETSKNILDSFGKKDVGVASGEAYSDALSSAPFLASKNAGLLLVKKDQKEIDKKYNPLYTIGGNLAVENTFGRRIAGKNRYETALKLSKENPDKKNLVIASGVNLADALSSGGLAGYKNSNILLLDSIPTKSYEDSIKSAGAIRIVGGAASVTKDVESKIKEMVKTEVSNTSSSSSRRGGSGSSSVTPKTDAKKLEEKIVSADKLVSDKDVKYVNATEAKKKAFDLALKEAKEIKKKVNPTQKEIDDALAKLTKSINELDGKKIDKPEEKPGEKPGEKPEEKPGEKPGEKPSEEKKTIVEDTGRVIGTDLEVSNYETRVYVGKEMKPFKIYPHIKGYKSLTAEGLPKGLRLDGTQIVGTPEAKDSDFPVDKTYITNSVKIKLEKDNTIYERAIDFYVMKFIDNDRDGIPYPEDEQDNYFDALIDKNDPVIVNGKVPTLDDFKAKIKNLPKDGDITLKYSGAEPKFDKIGDFNVNIYINGKNKQGKDMQESIATFPYKVVKPVGGEVKKPEKTVIYDNGQKIGTSADNGEHEKRWDNNAEGKPFKININLSKYENLTVEGLPEGLRLEGTQIIGTPNVADSEFPADSTYITKNIKIKVETEDSIYERTLEIYIMKSVDNDRDGKLSSEDVNDNCFDAVVDKNDPIVVDGKAPTIDDFKAKIKNLPKDGDIIVDYAFKSRIPKYDRTGEKDEVTLKISGKNKQGTDLDMSLVKIPYVVKNPVKPAETQALKF